jgi:hypothetical protein
MPKHSTVSRSHHPPLRIILTTQDVAHKSPLPQSPPKLTPPTRLHTPRPGPQHARFRAPMPRTRPLPTDRDPARAGHRADRREPHAAHAANRTAGPGLADGARRARRAARRMAGEFGQAV